MKAFEVEITEVDLEPYELGKSVAFTLNIPIGELFDIHEHIDNSVSHFHMGVYTMVIAKIKHYVKQMDSDYEFTPTFGLLEKCLVYNTKLDTVIVHTIRPGIAIGKYGRNVALFQGVSGVKKVEFKEIKVPCNLDKVHESYEGNTL